MVRKNVVLDRPLFCSSCARMHEYEMVDEDTLVDLLICGTSVRISALVRHIKQRWCVDEVRIAEILQMRKMAGKGHMSSRGSRAPSDGKIDRWSRESRSSTSSESEAELNDSLMSPAWNSKTHRIPTVKPTRGEGKSRPSSRGSSGRSPSPPATPPDRSSGQRTRDSVRRIARAAAERSSPRGARASLPTDRTTRSGKLAIVGRTPPRSPLALPPVTNPIPIAQQTPTSEQESQLGLVFDYIANIDGSSDSDVICATKATRFNMELGYSRHSSKEDTELFMSIVDAQYRERCSRRQWDRAWREACRRTGQHRIQRIIDIYISKIARHQRYKRRAKHASFLFHR